MASSFWNIIKDSTPPIYDPDGSAIKGIAIIGSIGLSVQDDGAGGQIAFVTAADVIKTIYGRPIRPITYYLKPNGGAYGAGHNDPEDERLEFNCDDLGAINCNVKIVDANAETWCEAPFVVSLEDGCTLCAP